MPISRRTLISATLASAGLSSASYSQAQTPEVKLALVAPLSGAWARTGQIMKTGAELAVADINAQGGIKSMGGAKIRLISADAGDSVEKAKNAAQRLLSQEPDLVGGIGAWLSSFTLAVTEVTERAQLPWVTLSYANQITERGFKYVVQDGPDSVRMADESLPAVLEVAQRAIGRKPQTVAIISDSTVVSQMLAKRMRDEGIKKYGIKIVVDETYGSPLSDATSMVQAVRQSRPDFLLFFSTNVPDAKLVLGQDDRTWIGSWAGADHRARHTSRLSRNASGGRRANARGFDVRMWQLALCKAGGDHRQPGYSQQRALVDTRHLVCLRRNLATERRYRTRRISGSRESHASAIRHVTLGRPCAILPR